MDYKKTISAAKRFNFYCINIKDNIYILGDIDGYSTNKNYNIECYNTSTDTLSNITKIPTERKGYSACALKDRIYIVGGMSSDEAYGIDLIECYDTTKKKWLPTQHLENSRYRAGMSSVENAMYIIGGWNNRVVDEVECLII